MNNVTLIGRLTRNPEVRRNGETAIASFSIAIDRPPKKDGTKEADFPRIVVFGKQAENCEKYLVQGRKVAIEGRIQTGSYTNRNGDKVYTTDVVASRVEFLEWGDRNQNDSNSAQPAAQPAAAPASAPAAQPAPEPAAAPAAPAAQPAPAPAAQPEPAAQPATQWEDVDDEW